MNIQRGIPSLALAFTVALSVQAMAEPLELRMNWAVAPSHITPMINEVPKSIYKHYGKSYTVKTTRMRGSGPALTALAAGELDIAAMNNQAFAQGIVNGKLDIRAVASLMRNVDDGVDNAFWVRKDSGIDTIKAVKGKRVAINALGSGLHAAALAILTRNGLKDGVDYQFVEVRFGAMLTSLKTNRVDVAYLVLPFNFRAEKEGLYKELFTMRQALGPQEVLLYVAKADFIAKNRKALTDFFEDHIRMRQWAYDPKNRKQAAAIIAKVMKRKAASYEPWVFTNKGYGRTVNAKFDMKILQKNIDDLHELKAVPGKVDVPKYSDLSLVSEAGKRLGL